MKRTFLNRIAATVLILAMSSIVLMSYTTHKIMANFWQQLGISEINFKSNIKESFLSGALRYYGVKNMKNIALNNRVALSTDLLNYAKKFVATQEFKKEYLKFREDMKPYAPETPKTKESIREEYIKRSESELQNIQKSLPTTTN